jgi:hypothetical protein
MQICNALHSSVLLFFCRTRILLTTLSNMLPDKAAQQELCKARVSRPKTSESVFHKKAPILKLPERLVPNASSR